MEGLSIIICCYNSAQRLPETINHLKAQENLDGISWEIIIVNNNSNDNTEEIADFLLKDSINYKIVKETQPGLFYARIKGITESSYEFLIFVDDDNWLDKDYLLNAYQIMKNNPSVGLCGGVGEGVFEIEPPAWFQYCEDSYAIGNCGRYNDGILSSSNCFLNGAGMVIRRKAYDELLKFGFKPTLIGRTGKTLMAGDDSELCAAMNLIGWKSFFSQKLIFKHYIIISRLNWEYYLKMLQGFSQSYLVISLYVIFLKYKSNYLFHYIVLIVQIHYSFFKNSLFVLLCNKDSQKFYHKKFFLSKFRFIESYKSFRKWSLFFNQIKILKNNTSIKSLVDANV